MLPDKLQKSFILGRSFLMAVAKADNHAGSFLPFVCAWNGGSFRRNADTDRSKPELRGLAVENAAALAAAGVRVAICTDHPETPVQYLPMCAALAVKGGLSREQALAAITIGAARIAGIADRVGSLTAGKDADIVITHGDPLDMLCQVRKVWIDGRLVKG